MSVVAAQPVELAKLVLVAPTLVLASMEEWMGLMSMQHRGLVLPAALQDALHGSEGD